MWKLPSVTKIYEALGAVADDRVEISGNAGKCYSSSRNKYYDISYDPDSSSIMSNDNVSYWKGELGYPAIAFLLRRDVLRYEENLGMLLKDIAWKDINQKFNNDFEAALNFILEGIDTEDKLKLEEYVKQLLDQIESLNLKKLGKRAIPPKGY